MALAVLALSIPFAAGAGGNAPGKAVGVQDNYVTPSLLDKAKTKPNESVDVIIQSTAGSAAAGNAYKGLGQLKKLSRSLDLVNGVAATLPAKLVEKLALVPGLSVTPDVPVRLSGTISTSTQLWPYESGNARLWWADKNTYASAMPTIAIVDSGVQDRPDFAGRLLANVNMSTLSGNSAGDGRGHGTFVAGIAAGDGVGLAGAAPNANLVSLDVMDDNGMAKTSDVIAACGWILANKAQYNIKVANFSLHSSYPSNFIHDALDQAVEKLWFSGVTVVVAAGNYGVATGPSGVKYAPGNDPFVITVGAIDLGGTAGIGNDSVAPWSAYGYTYDGFYKPEVAAAGRYMVGPIPPSSTIALQRPDKMVGTDRIQLSGTSFAAPVVAGTAAEILARHPDFGPDQVKGAIMVSARAISNGNNPKAAGLGEVTATKAVALRYGAPNPNMGLEQFLVSDPAGNGQVFDGVAWRNAVTTGAIAWSDIAWSDIAWSDSSMFAAVAWSDVAWSDVAWSDVSWSDVAWSDVAWSDASHEDAVAGDANDGGYALTPDDLAAIAADPALAVPTTDPQPASVTDPSVAPVPAPAPLLP